MSMQTNLHGRLRNTHLPLGHGLLPLFEAVVNSIDSIDESRKGEGYGDIRIEIIREPQTLLPLDDGKPKRGAPPIEDIRGFKVCDNGIGFTKANMDSFETLDTDYKASQGRRGVGRLLWLKAFDSAQISSVFQGDAGVLQLRTLSFNSTAGVSDNTVQDAPADAQPGTCVELRGFTKAYRERCPKSAKGIADDLLQHCLWYFVREGSSPRIRIRDGDDVIDLDDLYDQYMHTAATKQDIDVKGTKFEITHIKLKAGSLREHSIAWCAAERLVQEEPLAGKIPGLRGKLKDEIGDFTYACYVTSPFLDEHVRPERFGFDIKEMRDDLFSQTDINLDDIKEAVLNTVRAHLDQHLRENQTAVRERLDKFTAHKAPRYRPILARITDDKLNIEADASDKDLELWFHKQLSEIESALLQEGQELMNFGDAESKSDYEARLNSYLEKAADVKKSDLASYVFHRKVILDILQKAIQRDEKGKYVREDLIHELIMPMRTNSAETWSDNWNLWLIDERLAFHDYLASDKPLSALPITKSDETKEPDICALNVFDKPILVAEERNPPLACLVVIEIKRPMRNDAGQGEDKDPIEQALGYLDRIRKGGVTTHLGRPIPASEDLPGFCYVIADLTPSLQQRCRLHTLTITSDGLGYFGYNPNYKAYIEVISLDRLLNAAKQRNRAFFDQLGLTAT